MTWIGRINIRIVYVDKTRKTETRVEALDDCVEYKRDELVANGLDMFEARYNVNKVPPRAIRLSRLLEGCVEESCQDRGADAAHDIPERGSGDQKSRPKFLWMRPLSMSQARSQRQR